MDALESLRNKIEQLDKTNQIEILRILYQHVPNLITENKYGSHVNMVELDRDVLEKIELFVKHINNTRLLLHEQDQQREEYKRLLKDDIYIKQLPILTPGFRHHVDRGIVSQSHSTSATSSSSLFR